MGEKPHRVDGTGHHQVAGRYAPEPEAAVIRLVANEKHEVVAVLLGRLERPAHQRRPDTASLEGRFHRQGTQHQRGFAPGIDDGETHGADQQRADERGEGQFAKVRRTLAEAGSGAGKPTRAEGAFVQAIDGMIIARLLRTDGKRELSHEGTRVTAGRGLENEVQPCRRRVIRIRGIDRGASLKILRHSSVARALQTLLLPGIAAGFATQDLRQPPAGRLSGRIRAGPSGGRNPLRQSRDRVSSRETKVKVRIT